MWWSPFKVKLHGNSQNSCYTKNALHAFIPLSKDVKRYELVWWKSCQELTWPTIIKFPDLAVS